MNHGTEQEQIEKILRSHTFADKGQLQTLLEVLYRHIDSETVLKPTQVIRELWPEEIKTKRSTDVATEMNRLRKALELYYQLEGQNDPIRISLPNRSMPGPDGIKERRWIVAETVDVVETVAPPPPQTDPPVNSHKSVLILGVVLALALTILITVKMLSTDNQPDYGRLDGSTLVIMNAEGDELWHKHFPGGFRSGYYEQGMATRLWIGDIDGDGHNEILLLYDALGIPKTHSSQLICYSSNGKERWRWTPGKVLPEVTSPAIYNSVGLGILKAAPGQPRRIVVTSSHDLYYPGQIALIDANGKTISEYWHSGHLDHMILTSLDGGRSEQVIVSGIANGYHQATIIVLDSNGIYGASDERERPELQLHGLGVAKERLRILFPRSDLNTALSVYNIGEDVIEDGDLIRYSVQECQLVADCFIAYTFDRDFNLRLATAGDRFRSAHKAFYLTNPPHHEFSEEEDAEFSKIRCLSGCKSEYLPVQIQ